MMQKYLRKKWSKVRCGHCILRVNIACYQKQHDSIGAKTNTNYTAAPTKTHKGASQATKDSRTFTEVARGTSSRPLTSGANPIIIKPATISDGRADCVMVGETINIQHTVDLPTLLLIEGNPAGMVYYIGGLNVITKFINQKSVKAFYDNEHNWNHWFKWLKMGFNDDLIQERITWVKINGLPIHFRSNVNLELIANACVKTLEIIAIDWNAYDLSRGNVCIINKHNTIINEVVNVSCENNIFHVGVVEYDRDWSPFDRSILKEKVPHDNNNDDDEEDDVGDENYVQDEDEDPDSDEDAISATWVGTVQQNDGA